MLFKYIDFKFFIIALSIGLFYTYIVDDNKKIVIMYPTPDNIKEYQYKDKMDNCYTYDLNEVNCPDDENKYQTVKIQK
jgi:hypothetical protein